MPLLLSVRLPTFAMVKAEPTVPATPLTVKAETVRELSTSVSLVRTLPVTKTASSLPVALSETETGASLTAVTVSVSVEVVVRLPSDNV